MPLIVLEGPEGAGKTTQVAKLAERLTASGKAVVSLREPGGTHLGDKIRTLLLDPASEMSVASEALLFMASRAQHVEKRIRPALAEGATVLLDRFSLSTYAYQIAGRGLPEANVVAANRLAVGDVRPDVNVVLLLPVDEGLTRATSRGPRDRMEQADRDFHHRVLEAFGRFASAEWQVAHPEIGAVVVVDASGSEDEVHDRVIAAVRNHVRDVR